MTDRPEKINSWIKLRERTVLADITWCQFFLARISVIFFMQHSLECISQVKKKWYTTLDTLACSVQENTIRFEVATRCLMQSNYKLLISKLDLRQLRIIIEKRNQFLSSTAHYWRQNVARALRVSCGHINQTALSRDQRDRARTSDAWPASIMELLDFWFMEWAHNNFSMVATDYSAGRL